MNDPASPSRDPEPLGFMGWIAGYKLFKASLAGSAAVLVLRFIHTNLRHLAVEWLGRLDIDPQSRFATHLLAHIARIDPHRIHLFSAVLFVYAAIYATEGFGLFYRQRWAEWLTVVQTALLLPWEIYEIFHHYTHVRLWILSANLAVVIYLCWRIRHNELVRKRRVFPQSPQNL